MFIITLGSAGARRAATAASVAGAEVASSGGEQRWRAARCGWASARAQRGAAARNLQPRTRSPPPAARAPTARVGALPAPCIIDIGLGASCFCMRMPSSFWQKYFLRAWNDAAGM
eukprot:2430625-Prymnesium_polylepis.1